MNSFKIIVMKMIKWWLLPKSKAKLNISSRSSLSFEAKIEVNNNWPVTLTECLRQHLYPGLMKITVNQAFFELHISLASRLQNTKNLQQNSLDSSQVSSLTKPTSKENRSKKELV